MWENAQYILARAAENFIESHIDSCGDKGSSHSNLCISTFQPEVGYLR